MADRIGNASDIKIGLARIPARSVADKYGRVVWGWALPGGVFTASREEAKAAASLINKMLGGDQ